MDTWIVTFTGGTTVQVQAADVQHSPDWVDLLDEGGRALWAAPAVNVLHVGVASAVEPHAIEG